MVDLGPDCEWSPWGGTRSPEQRRSGLGAATPTPSHRSPLSSRPGTPTGSFAKRREEKHARQLKALGYTNSYIGASPASSPEASPASRRQSSLSSGRSNRHSAEELRTGIKPLTNLPLELLPEASFKGASKYRPNLSPRQKEALGLTTDAGYAEPCGNYPLRGSKKGFYTSQANLLLDPYHRPNEASVKFPRQLDAPGTHNGDKVEAAKYNDEIEELISGSASGHRRWSMTKQLQSIASGAFTRAPGIKNFLGGFEEAPSSSAYTNKKVAPVAIGIAKEDYSRKLRLAAKKYALKPTLFEAEKAKLQAELWEKIGKPGLEEKVDPYKKAAASTNWLDVQMTPTTDLRGGGASPSFGRGSPNGSRSASPSLHKASFVNRQADLELEARIKSPHLRRPVSVLP